MRFATQSIISLVTALCQLPIESQEAVFKVEFLNGVLRLYTSPSLNIDDLDNASDAIDLSGQLKLSQMELMNQQVTV